MVTPYKGNACPSCGGAGKNHHRLCVFMARLLASAIELRGLVDNLRRRKRENRASDADVLSEIARVAIEIQDEAIEAAGQVHPND